MREMKDSGIEWIETIPQGWDVARLKALFSFGKGLPITKDNLVENGNAVISYGQIHSKINIGWLWKLRIHTRRNATLCRLPHYYLAR